MNAKTVILGTLFGALTLYGWETISNTAIPWHAWTMKEFADTGAVVRTLKANAPTNGMYVETRGVVAAVSFTPDLRDKTTLLGLMLGRQFALDVVVAFVVLMAILRLPRATTRQYAFGMAAVAFAVSASVLVSDWNWYGFSPSWTIVNLLDRTIGYALMGFVIGASVNKWSARRTTDEWGGVKAPTGLPSTMGAPARK